MPASEMGRRMDNAAWGLVGGIGGAMMGTSSNCDGAYMQQRQTAQQALNNAYHQQQLRAAQMQMMPDPYAVPIRIAEAPDSLLNPLADHFRKPNEAFPKGEDMALTKEQRPQGWKAGLVIVAAALIAFKLWKNRDEIFVNLEKMAGDLGTKLGIGDLPTEEKK